MAADNTGLIEMPDLETSSVCLALYEDFLTSFSEVQDGRVDISLQVRLQNAAYHFARPIAAALGDQSGSAGEGVLLGYLPKSGGSMSGMLKAYNGFEAGKNGQKVFSTFYREAEIPEKGVEISGEIHLEGNGLWMNGKHVFEYRPSLLFPEAAVLVVDGGHQVDFCSSVLVTKGSLQIGSTPEDSFIVSTEKLCYQGQDLYHSGNANSEHINWTMQDGLVAGKLVVNGVSQFNEMISGLRGAVLGYNGQEVLGIAEGCLILSGDLALRDSYGIKVADHYVLHREKDQHIRLGSIGGGLILGGENTPDIRLWSSVYSENGDHELITKGGGASFTDFFQAGFGYGSPLLSTVEHGVVVHEELRLGDSSGPVVKGDGEHIVFSSQVLYEDHRNTHSCKLYFAPSEQYMERESDSAYFETDSDYFVFNKPVTSREFIGISESLTKLSDRLLLLSDDHYILDTSSGLKFSGPSIFKDSISSERYSSGFAGEGWKIENNRVTGNVSGTFDELTIRKKMRVYELEVQQVSATNGSLWVSDHCKGDRVIEIT